MALTDIQLQMKVLEMMSKVSQTADELSAERNSYISAGTAGEHYKRIVEINKACERAKGARSALIDVHLLLKENTNQRALEREARARERARAKGIE